MTRSVDDIVDVAIGILMAAFMLSMGVWCWRYMLALYSQPVVEKTAPTVQLQERAPEYAYTGEDCLLELVVNDDFCPDPAIIEFRYPDKGSYTITYDKAWFDNKEDNIKKAYTDFFISAVNATKVVFELEYASDGVTPVKWVANMK